MLLSFALPLGPRYAPCNSPLFSVQGEMNNGKEWQVRGNETELCEFSMKYETGGGEKQLFWKVGKKTAPDPKKNLP